MGLSDALARVTDPYERKARLWPALLALLPMVLAIWVLYGSALSVLTNIAVLIASCGGLYLLANICRERGKQLEPKLFKNWGGKPSTQLLRHTDETIEGVTKRRYHAFLSRRINTAFPDEAQELSDSRAADDVYQSGVRWILNQTRDTEKFGLLFAENISYGFRRNALGLRPVGLVVVIVAFAWVLIVQGVISFSSTQPWNLGAFATMPSEAVVSIGASMVMLCVWLLVLTEACVRTAAFAYAETLLRACDALDG